MSKLGVTLDILNQKGTPAFYSDIFTNRPAAGFAGRVFISTDTGAIYEDTGSTWTLIADATGIVTTPSLQSVTTVGKTTNQGISITAGGLTSNTIDLTAQALSSTASYLGQVMADNDFWKIYGNASVSDKGEMVFLVGDNGQDYSIGGERFRFSYDASGGGTAKDVLLLDYSTSTFNTDLIANNLTSSSLTLGSVLFAGTSGVLSQDNTNLFWDNTSKYLGIGPTGGPTAPLDIHNGTANVLLQLNATSTNNSNLAFLNGGVGKWRIGNLYNAGANSFQIYDVLNTTARLTILNTGATTLNGNFTATSLIKNGGTSAQILAADGSVITAGTNITISGGTISSSGGGGSIAIGSTITSATAGSVLYAGASGVLAQNNANFYFDYTNLRLGIGTNTPSYSLHITGNTVTNVYGYIANTNASGTAAWLSQNDSSDQLSARIFGSTNGGSQFGLTLNRSSSLTANIATTGYLAIGSTSNSPMVFGTNNLERMRLFAGGNVIISGTTDAGYKLDVQGTLRTSSSVAIGYSSNPTPPSNGLQVSGNVGIGVTPSSWNTINNIQVNNGSFAATSAQVFVGNNWYYQTGDKYISTAAAGLFQINGNVFSWLQASSGTAGNAITFNVSMYLDSSNNLGIGTSTIGSRLQVNGNVAIGYSASTLAPNNGLAVSGKVGIGTITPSSLLHLYGTDNTAVSSKTFWDFTFVGQEITNASTTLNTVAGLSFTGGTSRSSVSAIGNILESTTLGALGFFTGGSGISGNNVPERMRIVSAGNILMGSSTDNGQGVLQVTGGITANDISLTGATYAATATITKNYYSLFTGSTGQTLTLPSPSSNNYQYVIINTTANSVTIAAATSTNIITTTNTSVASITLIANARCFLIADGNNKYYQVY